MTQQNKEQTRIAHEEGTSPAAILGLSLEEAYKIGEEGIALIKTIRDGEVQDDAQMVEAVSKVEGLSEKGKLLLAIKTNDFLNRTNSNPLAGILEGLLGDE